MAELDVNVGGTWHKVITVAANVAGTWKTIQSGWVNVAGTWQRFYQRFTGSTSPHAAGSASTETSPVGAVQVVMEGYAGGGGGGSTASSSIAVGGGAGGGGYFKKTIALSGSGGESWTYSVGRGGTGASVISVAQPGHIGQDTTVSGYGISGTLSAGAGNYGGTSATAPGAGGSPTGGDAGSSSGTTGTGSSGGAGAGPLGGAGGTSRHAGSTYGGGGGGGSGQNDGGGFNGGDGYLLFTYT